MKIVYSALVILLILLTGGFHVRVVWKDKNYKLLSVQMVIMAAAALFAITGIYCSAHFSISQSLNEASPWRFGTGGAHHG